MASKTAFPADARGKVDAALDLKEKGNTFFKNGDYKKAIRQYAMSLAYTKGMPGRSSTNNVLSAVAAPEMLSSTSAGNIGPLTPELEHEINSLEVIVKTNMAACYIKLGDAEKALKSVNEALTLNPKAWKSSIRLAEAHVLAKNYEKAISICDQLLPTIPSADSDPAAKGAVGAIKAVKQKANELLKVEMQKQRDSFKNIFNK